MYLFVACVTFQVGTAGASGSDAGVETAVLAGVDVFGAAVGAAAVVLVGIDVFGAVAVSGPVAAASCRSSVGVVAVFVCDRCPVALEVSSVGCSAAPQAAGSSMSVAANSRAMRAIGSWRLVSCVFPPG